MKTLRRKNLSIDVLSKKDKFENYLKQREFSDETIDELLNLREEALPISGLDLHYFETMIRRQEEKRSFLRQVINLEFEEYMILIIYSIAYVFLSVVNKTTILFGETTRGQDLFFSFYVIMLLAATIKFAFEYKLPQFVRFTLIAIYSICFAYVVNLATSSF
ncbi:hypothetical protein [Halobacteriovorax sp. CON-3]|uniref:hypothetical protein n=1 Tax=Halobacteriovorax sp. CON-3 TaxID=3157710 RepID=UPI00371058A8